MNALLPANGCVFLSSLGLSTLLSDMQDLQQVQPLLAQVQDQLQQLQELQMLAPCFRGCGECQSLVSFRCQGVRVI